MSEPRLTRVISVNADTPDPAAIDEAARVLVVGGLVAFATETVYGLGAVATAPDAVARIFAAKGRPSINPLIVHVDDVDRARACVSEWPTIADQLAAQFWPGPLTMVLPRSAVIPDIVTAGMPTVGVRCPALRVARHLITRSNRPLAAPSANRSNRLSPTRAEHVLADLDGRIDVILDSGPTSVGLESTVLDLSIDPPRLLRPGPITAEQLSEALGGRELILPSAGSSTDRPASPGQMPIHYAPRTPAFRLELDEEWRDRPDLAGWAILLFGPGPIGSGREIRLESPDQAAHRLYDVLHDLDKQHLPGILAIMPPAQPEWRAVRDRLLRATRPMTSP